MCLSKTSEHRPQQGQCSAGAHAAAIRSGFLALGGNPKLGHIKIKIGPLNDQMKREPKVTDYI